MKWKFLLVLALPVVAFFGVKTYLHLQVGKAMDAIVTQLSPIATIRYDSVTSSLDGRLGVTGIVIRPHEVADEVTIEEISVKTPSMLYVLDLENRIAESDIPSELSARIVGVSMPTNGQLLKELEDAMYADEPEARLAAFENCVTRTSALPSQQYLLKYPNIDVDAQMGYRFDELEGEFVLHFSAAQAGAYETSGEFAIPLQNFNLFALQSAFAEPTIARASLKITDSGYFSRMYEYCEQENMIEREQVTELLADQYLEMFSEFQIEPSTEIVDDYRRWVDGGSELLVSVHPRKPQQLKYMDLYTPEDVLTLLNLQTQVN